MHSCIHKNHSAICDATKEAGLKSRHLKSPAVSWMGDDTADSRVATTQDPLSISPCSVTVSRMMIYCSVSVQTFGGIGSSCYLRNGDMLAECISDICDDVYSTGRTIA